MVNSTTSRKLACRFGRRAAVHGGLQAVLFLIWGVAIAAANPTIKEIAISGSNSNLHIAISGSGFGAAPRGVPCIKCTTPYLNIADGRGYGCQLFNILSWSDSSIVFTGFEGNPGDSVLVSVTNVLTNLSAVTGATIPQTVSLATPVIRSVAFAGGVGANLQITVTGSGFGSSPPGLPFDGDLPFFSFIAKPFAVHAWEAGYGTNTVTLKYAIWSPTRILIVGFGGTFGTKFFKLVQNEPVAIAVANSGTCGLNMNIEDASLGPTSIGGVWGGHLP